MRGNAAAAAAGTAQVTPGAGRHPPLRARPQRREPRPGGRASVSGYLRTWDAPAAGRMAQPAAEEACGCAAAAPGDDGEEMNGRKVALITGITGQVTAGTPLVRVCSRQRRERGWGGKDPPRWQP